ncbi:Vitamin B12 transporter BtuB precursor [Aliarcobacter thereius]|nr:Vitamin B12 transporter BtuB precursor [Aliarcobacter thereius]
MKKSIISLSLIASASLAQSYNLGQVNVEAKKNQNINVFEKTITSDDISRDNSIDISDALDNISGVSKDIQGGRGESTIHIRGFNSKRVGVFIDGVPIYVPYDGNFDYGRFLTTDISQIDVSKAYSSVVFGGNTMGGVVNIISKKPKKEFEGNIKAEMIFDSNMKMARHIESLNLGTMQKNGFYTQVGASYSKQDHFRMSDDFKGNSHQASGDRLRSENEDKKISLKVGYVANDDSEISINYSNQKGEKQQAPVTDTSFAKEKYWDWPKVDKESISIVGQKNFNNSYVKALAYYDSSKNNLNSYKDNTYSSFDNNKKTFKNENEDYTYGARVEYGLANDNNFFKTATNYKKDSHKTYDIGKTNNKKTLSENYEDHTISLGVENIYNITPKLELLAGLSYDMKKADKLYDTETKYLNMMKLEENDSFSPQAALIYSIDDDSKLKVSISKKTYMP